MTAPPASAFDPDQLRLRGLTALLGKAFGNPPQWAFGLVRTFWPILPVPAWYDLTPNFPIPWPPIWRLVTRYADVVEVLTNHEVFKVAMAEETRLLNDGVPDGTSFILGLDGDEEYWRQLRLVMAYFKRDDVATIVVPAAREAAQRIVESSDGRLDAVQDLILEAPLRLCEQYYGLVVPPESRKQFKLATIAMSGYLFGPPFSRPSMQQTVLAGADIVREVIRASVDQELDRAAKEPGSPPKDTVLARLARGGLDKDSGLDRLLICSFITGMVIGFVPTNTMAAGHILEMLLSRRDFLEAAQAAAHSGDDALLSRCLFEAMRFMPLNPGPWRRCACDYVLARGTWRATKIRKGTYVLASTQSAMFDPRQIADPYRFDPGRAASDYMLFGHGLHWCAGRFIADAQITQMFKALLLKTNLRRAEGRDGTLRLLGLFPEHLTVEFDP